MLRRGCCCFRCKSSPEECASSSWCQAAAYAPAAYASAVAADVAAEVTADVAADVAAVAAACVRSSSCRMKRKRWFSSPFW